jgi:hypothetical protein
MREPEILPQAVETNRKITAKQNQQTKIHLYGGF